MPILRLEMIEELASGLRGNWIGRYDSSSEGMSLSLRDHSRKATVGISYNFFSTSPAGYLLGASVIGRMTFEEVESIIRKYYKKYDIPLRLYTCRKVSIRVPEMDGVPSEYRISNPGDTKKVIDKIQMMVDDMMPFFERFKTLEDVYEHLESDELENKTSFINSQGFVTRRLIMRALFKANNFHDLGSRYLKFLETKLKDSNYKYEALYLPEMFEELCQIHAGT